MNREEAHELIDQLFDMSVGPEPPETERPETAKMTTTDKRVVRTKTSGDRVYLLDEVANTRQWVTSGEVLTSLGFSMDDVKEVDDTEMLKYQMASAIYKIDA